MVAQPMRQEKEGLLPMKQLLNQLVLDLLVETRWVAP